MPVGYMVYSNQVAPDLALALRQPRHPRSLPSEFVLSDHSARRTTELAVDGEYLRGKARASSIAYGIKLRARSSDEIVHKRYHPGPNGGILPQRGREVSFRPSKDGGGVTGCDSSF